MQRDRREQRQPKAKARPGTKTGGCQFQFSFYSSLGGCLGINFFQQIRRVHADTLVGIIQEFYQQRNGLTTLVREFLSETLEQSVGRLIAHVSELAGQPFGQKRDCVRAGSTG